MEGVMRVGPGQDLLDTQRLAPDHGLHAAVFGKHEAEALAARQTAAGVPEVLVDRAPDLAARAHHLARSRRGPFSGGCVMRIGPGEDSFER